jgi:hypothetical protein
MFKKLSVFLFLMLPVLAFCQVGSRNKLRAGAPQDSTAKAKVKPDMVATVPADTVATIDMYKIVTLQRDTILIDTALTIQAEYAANYLRKDNFGLLPLSNDGQSYNMLDFGLTKFDPFPSFGFKAKHYAYVDGEDVNYYNVATPYTDILYRSTQSQGQILDALFTVNTSERLNLFVGYKGLRSIGKYINSLSSNGVFRFGGSYNTTDKRYFLKFHFTGQDFSNEENGGITDTSLFESGEDPYTNRERLEVYFTDARSLLKGNRYFIDHTFRLNKSNPNSIVFHHQFSYENKFFEFTQPTVSARLGEAYTTSINNKTRFNKMYNLVGAAYSNETVGAVEFYIENYNYNYYYRSIILDNNFGVRIPNALNDEIYNYGAKYTYQKNKWYGTALVSNSITNQSLSNIDLQAKYKFDDKNMVSARYQKMNKLPDLNYNLYQSDYKSYNWSNDYKNEKINSFEFEAKTQWFDASLQYTILKDHLYFSDDYVPEIITATTVDTLKVSPKQFENTINYLSLKAHREFKFWKLGLDNTLLYQNVKQGQDILNVPSFVTRNTLYYSDLWFKKALAIQAGITFQYFSEYYANDYNPLIGEFYSQNQKKIGGFPLMDFFVNLKIQEFRLFVKAEHFNSSMTGYKFYSAPNYPYRDFTVRFGIIWNFFS